jgi:hypothetical protein
MEKSLSLKSMINNVVEDIGALKAFTPCNLSNRKLQFINGMSANEEVGCVNNWKRLGFDKCDLATHSATFVSTIVNNRSDRIRRSRVFAEIVANALCADRHFLIGTNLSGLKNYIIKAWKITLEDLIRLMKVSDPLPLLDRAFIRLHVAIIEEDKDKRIKAILGAENSETKEVADNFINEFTLEYEQYLKLKNLITGSTFPEEEVRSILTSIFIKKIVIIEEDKSSSDEILTKILEHTPPGFVHKLMGIQNIKTPGIDLIRAWQQWEVCYKACNYIRSGDRTLLENSLLILSEFTNFNILSQQYVKQTISELKELELNNFSVSISKIKNALDRISIKNGVTKFGFFQKILIQIMDVRKKIKDKNLVEQIYKDLIDKRISLPKAAHELKKYTQDADI